MAVGAKDYIDQLLVQKYATEQVDNHDDKPSKMNFEQVTAYMYGSSCSNMTFVNNSRSNSNLQNICKAVTAKAAVGNNAYRNTQKEREQLTAS